MFFPYTLYLRYAISIDYRIICNQNCDHVVGLSDKRKHLVAQRTEIGRHPRAEQNTKLRPPHPPNSNIQQIATQ